MGLVHDTIRSLAAIDQAKEPNEVGLNKFDRAACTTSEIWNWPPRRLILTALKYHKQLSVSIIEQLQQELSRLPTQPTAKAVPGIVLVGGGLAFTGSVDNKMFNAFLTICRENGKYLVSYKSWKIAGEKFLETLEKLSEYGFDISGIEPTAALLEITEVDRRVKTIYVDYYDGMIRIKYPYTDKISRFFNNSSGNLSGITEYDPRDSSRITNSFALAEEAVIKLRELGYEVTIDSKYTEQSFLYMKHKMESELPIAALVGLISTPLMAHQNRGIRFISQCTGRAIIGACMGSGKTLMALAFAVINDLDIVVIAPKTVRRNWINEAIKFFPTVFNQSNSREFDGKLPKKFPWKNLKLVCTNYENTAKIQGKYDLLIVDESHMIKDAGSKRSLDVAELSRQIPYVIELSGTVALNKRSDFCSQLAIIGVHYSKQEVDAMSIGAFWHKIAPYYLSMPKSEVLPFLPEKTVTMHRDEVLHPVSMATAIGDVSKAKVEAALSKIEITTHLIKDVLENLDDCALIFSDSLEVTLELYRRFKSVSILHHGQMTDACRETAKENFQNRTDPSRRLLISTRQSLAVGVTLTAATVVIFNDLPWTPAHIAQAEDRVHRIGQNRPVFVKWVVAENSDFDRRVCEILRQKMEIVCAVNEGKQVTRMQLDFLNSSMEKIMEKI